jgi:simple sugar transport system permease protein
MRWLIPIAAVAVTFILTAALGVVAGANPLQVYRYFFIEPLASRVGSIEVLVKSTPLLLTGVATAIAFLAGYWNIGAEGQVYAGATLATLLGMFLPDTMPQPLGILLMVLVGFLGGALWALPPAWLKVRLSVDEVVTTLLLNSVMVFILSALLNGPWRDPISNWPQSSNIVMAAQLPKLIARSRLHLGFVLSVAWIFIMWFIMTRTAFGLKMRAVGKGRKAAQYAGINVGRTILITALLSGGIAGLAGMGEVAGIHYHLTEPMVRGYGYTGIIVAMFGGLNVFGVGLAALFLGLIDTGAQTVSWALGVPVYLGNVVEGALLLVTLGMLVLQNYRIRRA